MAKCSVVGCSGKVVGGFQEMIAPGTFSNPTATIPGQRTFWCEEDKQSLRGTLGQGRFLTAKELAVE